MRLLSWNILQGGGKRSLDIADAIVEFKPDVGIFQEFRNGKSAPVILDACQQLTLNHRHISTSEARKNTVMIASKYPISTSSWDADLDADLAIDVKIDLTSISNTDEQLRLLAAHLPQKKAQVPYLDALYKMPIDKGLIQHEGTDNTVIIGDLNCGIPFEDSDTKSFVNTHMFQALLGKGWIDSWRKRNPNTKEFSWVSSRGNGYRYDHALCTASLDKRIQHIEYQHNVRESRLSDHSALIIDIDFT